MMGKLLLRAECILLICNLAPGTHSDALLLVGLGVHGNISLRMSTKTTLPCISSLPLMVPIMFSCLVTVEALIVVYTLKAHLETVGARECSRVFWMFGWAWILR